jgi:hypothetical protein
MLIVLKHEYNVIDIRKETLKKRAADFCRMCSSLLAIADIREFETTEVYSSLDITRVKYNMYIHPRDEQEKVTYTQQLNTLRKYTFDMMVKIKFRIQKYS